MSRRSWFEPRRGKTFFVALMKEPWFCLFCFVLSFFLSSFLLSLSSSSLALHSPGEVQGRGPSQAGGRHEVWGLPTIPLRRVRTPSTVPVSSTALNVM